MLIKGNNEHGGDIYTHKVKLDYSANISPMGTPDFIKEAIIASAQEVSAYPDSYCNELRIALSKYEAIPKDFIVCGNGAADIIFSFVNALKPKNALIVTPTFCEYEQVLHLVESNIFYYELEASNSFKLTEDILNQINDTLDTIFICNPNNPTGQLYSKELMIKISDKCKRHQVILFCDECFMDLTDKPANHSIVDEISKNEYLFVLKAFTKSFGMAGVRLGYGLSSNEKLLEKISKNTQIWNVSTVAQKAGEAAVENSEFLEKVRIVVGQQRDYLTKELLKLGLEVFESKVNFILFKAEVGLYEKLMEQKIMIRRCENFKGLNGYYYRCAVKNKEENKILIQALAEREI